METIALYAWAKTHKIPYSRAQKLFNEGKIEGAFREGKRVRVPTDAQPPHEEKISCLVCGEPVTQITSSHVKKHGMTLGQYKTAYPHAPIVSTEVSKKISKAAAAQVKDDEWCQNISRGRTGVIPKNHPRFVKGAWKPSETLRQKWSELRKGRKHSEETKRKIGDAHRGVPETEEARLNNQQAQQEYWEDRDGSRKGVTLTEEHKGKISKVRGEFEETVSEEYKEERRERLISYSRGKKRTPEQKKRYSDARVRYMQENPEDWQKFTETNLEKEIAAWLIDQGIEFRTQCFIGKHPYDFYLPEYKVLIEADGPHHWEGPWWITDKVEKQRLFEEQLLKDAENNLTAGKYGYRIVRLRGRNSIGDEGSGTLEEQFVEQV